MTINPRTKPAQRIANQESTQFVLASDGSFSTPKYGVAGRDCRRLSKRASAPVELERDHGIRRCPGLRMLIARAIFCVCSVLHTFTNRVLSMGSGRYSLWGCTAAILDWYKGVTAMRD